MNPLKHLFLLRKLLTKENNTYALVLTNKIKPTKDRTLVTIVLDNGDNGDTQIVCPRCKIATGFGAPTRRG